MLNFNDQRSASRKAVAPVIGRPSLPQLDVEPIVQSVIDAVESEAVLSSEMRTSYELS
jgi:hypothetical protein